MVRKYTPRELRQKKATIKFAKTFIALSTILFVLTSLPSLLLMLAGYASAYLGVEAWRMSPGDTCGLGSHSASGKVAVVTGANSGVGYEAALSLAMLGAEKVVLGCRDVKKCTYAKALIDATRSTTCFPRSGAAYESNVHVPVAGLDLGDLSSVRSWSEALADVTPYVTTLVLNAGVMSTPLEPRTPQGLETQLGVNHVGHAYLVRRLEAFLETSPGGEVGEVERRIVALSSVAAQTPWSTDLDDLNWSGSRSFDSLRAYSQSKRLNLLYAQHLHSSTPSNVKVLAAHPGYSRTNLFHNGWSFLPSSLSWVKDLARENLVFSMSPYEGAMMTVRACVDPGLASGSYVVPLLWGVGMPVVSEPRPARFYEKGVGGGVVYPFLGTAWSKLYGGWGWQVEDAEKLAEWTDAVVRRFEGEE